MNNVVDEKEEFDYLIKCFSISLKEIKKYMKMSDSELYERDIEISLDELKKCKVKILNYMNYKNISNIAKQYESFETYEVAVLPYLKKCNKIIEQYKKQV